MDNLSEYFQNRTNERSVRAIAKRIGADPSTVNRQITGASAITVETVVQICRAYHLDLADAFVAAGFITADEAARFDDGHALARITDLELAREIVRRLEAGVAGPELTEPMAVDAEDATREPIPFPRAVEEDVVDPVETLPRVARDADPETDDEEQHP